MAIVAGIVALVGAGAAAYSNSQNKKALKKQSALADQQAEIGSNQWNAYQRLYAPREKQLLDDAFDQRRTPTAEAARAGAEASSAADTAQQVGLRNAKKLGINPSSPAYADINREQQAGRAGLISSAKTFGRRSADEINFNRQNALVSQGRGLVSDAVSANDSSFGMLQSLAQLQGQRDQMTGELIGTGAGYLTSGLSDYLKGRKTPATTPGLNMSKRPMNTVAELFGT